METGERRFIGGEAPQHMPVPSLEFRIAEIFLMFGKKLGGPAVERGLPPRQRGVERPEHAAHPGDLRAGPGSIPAAGPHDLQDTAIEAPAGGRAVSIDGARPVETWAWLPEPALRVQPHRHVLALPDRHRPEKRAIAAESAGKADILGCGGHGRRTLT